MLKSSLYAFSSPEVFYTNFPAVLTKKILAKYDPSFHKVFPDNDFSHYLLGLGSKAKNNKFFRAIIYRNWEIEIRKQGQQML